MLETDARQGPTKQDLHTCTYAPCGLNCSLWLGFLRNHNKRLSLDDCIYVSTCLFTLIRTAGIIIFSRSSNAVIIRNSINLMHKIKDGLDTILLIFIKLLEWRVFFELRVLFKGGLFEEIRYLLTSLV